MSYLTEQEYEKELCALAGDIIAEIRDELDDENDIDELRYAVSDRIHETVDGHRWIIYYMYNLQTIRCSRNPDAYEDFYSSEDLGELLKDKGLEGFHCVLAYCAMVQDLSEEVSTQIDEIEC